MAFKINSANLDCSVSSKHKLCARGGLLLPFLCCDLRANPIMLDAWIIENEPESVYFWWCWESKNTDEKKLSGKTPHWGSYLSHLVRVYDYNLLQFLVSYLVHFD